MQKYIGQMQPAFLISEGYPHLCQMVAFLDGITFKLNVHIMYYISTNYISSLLRKNIRVSKTTLLCFQMLHPNKFFLVASFDDSTV